MTEIFDDLDEAIFHSETYQKIAWLKVDHRQAADRLLARIQDDVTLNNIKITETLVGSRPVIHVAGKIIESDFQLYLVWQNDDVAE